jgi:CubicO group peptidase (beta-lactamase class C family)
VRRTRPGGRRHGSRPAERPTAAAICIPFASTARAARLRSFHVFVLALVVAAGVATACIAPPRATAVTAEHQRPRPPSALAQSANKSVPHLDLVRRYVDAFNTGEPTRLAAAIDSLYAPAFLADFGGPAAAAWDRLELFRTYGPLDFEHVDTTASPPIVWTRSPLSRGWVGHQLYLSDGPEQRVTRHAIWRVRPLPFPKAALVDADVARQMRDYLREMSHAGRFSGSVTMSHRGNIVLNGSWGLDGQLTPAPVTPATRFHIGSVTKLLTATAVLQLVEAGVLTLDDMLGRWIPEYSPPYRDSVRIRHLLAHTSGIELDENPLYLAESRVARTAAELLQAQLRHIGGNELSFTPGSEYDYTSEGVDLLGVIIERATGRPWTDVVREKILRPASMQLTRFAVPLGEGGWALGRTSFNLDLQTTTPGTLRSALEVLTVVAKPSSGVWSTAGDLHSFMRAVLDGRLLGRAWRDSLLTPHLETFQLPKYGLRSWVGLGAQGEDLWGVPTVGHGGVVPGYSAAIEYLPESDWLLTVVSNTGEASAFLVFQRFLELVVGQSIRSAPASAPN